MSYLIIFLAIIINIVILLMLYCKRKKWDTVEGEIIDSTAQFFNYDTFDYVTYQFYYEGILYEIKEEFGNERTPSERSKVTVYVNPKDIFRSTIKPNNITQYLFSSIIGLFIFLAIFIYRTFIEKQ